jgi:hypothetical protein
MTERTVISRAGRTQICSNLAYPNGCTPLWLSGSGEMLMCLPGNLKRDSLESKWDSPYTGSYGGPYRTCVYFNWGADQHAVETDN